MTTLKPTDSVTRIITPRGLPGGVARQLVATLYGDGRITIREHRRRSGAQTYDLGTLYVRTLLTRANLHL